MDGLPAPKILITRLSHIGDCLLTLPMLNALKDQFPDAKIAWAVESPTQQLLSLHPKIDSIIQIPKSWAGKPSCWSELRNQLRSHQFDIAIDPQGITKSAALGWLSGASKRIGIRGRWGRELSTWLNNQLVETQAPHIVDRSIELVSGLVSSFSIIPNEPLPARFDLPICPISASNVDQWLQGISNQHDIDPSRVVMINPGGSWASKRWEMDRFGSVACHLKKAHDLTSVIVWAGDEELQMAEAIHRQTQAEGGENASVIADKTSLRDLAALAARCQFFIGSDTGPMHLAAAMGTPCVGLFGTTRPTESGAYGKQHLHVQAWYQDGTCRQRRNAANDAMRAIAIADVTDACDRMIANQALQLQGSTDQQTANLNRLDCSAA